jgi:cell division protein FtsB
MAQRVRTPRDKDRTIRRVGILALVVVCAFLVMHEIYGDNGVLAMQRKRREHHSLEQQVQRLRQENHDLEQQVKKLTSDPFTIEQRAREELDLARPHERIYKFDTKHSTVVTVPEP